MTFLFYPAVAITTAVIGAATYVWFQRPALIYKMIIRLLLRKAGLTIKYEQLGGSKFCYAERGTSTPERSSIVFVHGFTSSKDSWVSTMKGLPRDQHVVAVDLLGHGETSLPAAFERVSVDYIAEHLHKFLSLAGLVRRPVHMIGTSMGGIVAAIYAAEYPNDIKALTLICPAVFTPIKSKFKREFNPDRNPLLARNIEDVYVCLDLCVFHKDRIPRNKQLLKGGLQLRECKMEFFTLLHKSIQVRNVTDDLTRELSPRIRQPTQIIWGANDELIDVSGAEFLRDLLPDCRRMDILSNCGHAASLDQPEHLTASIMAFRADIKA